ncbi:MAG: hypothetical protein IJW51_08875, partial [Clostridia bacterium]|nr:hypothetical protein [Clostridia bacterium]
ADANDALLCKARVRIRRPKVGVLARQAQGARIFKPQGLNTSLFLRDQSPCLFCVAAGADANDALLCKARVRIRRPKVGKLAWQAQGARIFKPQGLNTSLILNKNRAPT